MYTEDQAKSIGKNIKTYIGLDAFRILEIISKEKDINHADLHKEAKTSKFVTDKCITSFVVANLITLRLEGVKRYYTITSDGRNVLKFKGE